MRVSNKITGKIRVKNKSIPEWPECARFYDLMQTYRHALVEDQKAVIAAYKNVKKWLRQNRGLLVYLSEPEHEYTPYDDDPGTLGP